MGIKLPLLVAVGFGLFMGLHAAVHAIAGDSPNNKAKYFWLMIQAGMCWWTNIPPTIGLVLTGPGYVNANSRAQKDAAPGWIHRCWLAHLNTHENFPIFAAGFFVAINLQLDDSVI